MISKRRIARNITPATAGDEIEHLLAEVLAKRDVSITKYLAEAVRQQLIKNSTSEAVAGTGYAGTHQPEPMAAIKNTRDSIEIIADILTLGEVGKTRIKYEVGLDHGQTEKYLNFLLRAGFLETGNSGERGATYQASRLGLQLLRRIEAVEDMLNMGKLDSGR
jgi:predicted transcriptional regulator